METKSNYVVVGAITLLLLALLAAFTVWLSRAGEGSKKEYDIFFQQSVNGLAKGSGVPNKDKVGKVSVAQLDEIVRLKGADLKARDGEHARRMVEGTARSMGITIEG